MDQRSSATRVGALSIGIAALHGLAACQAVVPPSAPSAPERRLTVGTDQYGQTVRARIGDVLSLVVPERGREWVVAFDTAVLAAALPPEQMRRPTASEWLVRCVAEGQTALTATALPQPCPGEQPCPPAQFQFNLTVEVSK